MDYVHIEFVGRCPCCSGRLGGHSEPLAFVHVLSAGEDFVDIQHVCLVSPFLQGGDVELLQPALVARKCVLHLTLNHCCVATAFFVCPEPKPILKFCRLSRSH